MFKLRVALKSVLLLTLLILIAVPACWAENPPLPSPKVPLDQWLQGPELHLPGWDVGVEPPLLTFQLRYAVFVRARADVSKAKLAGHDLHVYIKVAQQSGNWLPDDRHSSVRQIPKSADVSVTETFLAKPGDYRIAFIIYDPIAETHGVWRKTVHVPGAGYLPDYPKAPLVQFPANDEILLRNVQPALVPIGNHRPLRIEIILNVTERKELELGDPDPRRATPALHPLGSRNSTVFGHAPDWMLGRSRQDVASEALLSVTNALASVKLNGCVRVSALDALRSKVLLDHVADFKPAELLESIRKAREVHQVDLRTLTLRQQSEAFFRSFLERTIGDTAVCAANEDRAVVIISDSLVFPANAQVSPVVGSPQVTHYYFFRLSIPDFLGQYASRYDFHGVASYTPLAVPPEDQVARLLHDVNVQRFDLTQPKDFQKALPHFLEDLSHAP